MARLIKWLFIVFFLLGMLLGMMAVNSLADYSSVTQPSALNSDELKRVKQFIKANNPSNLQTGQTASTQISEQDLNHTLNYLTQKAPHLLSQRVWVKTMFDTKQALLQVSIRLPSNPFGTFINVSTVLNAAQSAGDLKINMHSLQLGKNNVPDFITAMLASYIHDRLVVDVPEYNLISQSIKNIQLEKNRMTVGYVWDKQAVEQIKSQLSSRVMSGEFKLALLAYANHLARVSYSLSTRASLNQLLKPMFSLAIRRSKANNPITENKALFVALGAYSLKKNIPELLGERPEAKANHKRIYLKGRHDLSKHLMLSAAITSLADPELASSIGLQKEVKDSQGGSGFSFADLAADHAGIVLAEEAIASKNKARRIQAILSKVDSESVYMPDIENLPEGLEESEFESIYKNVNSKEYKKLEQLIAYRIEALPVYSENN